MSNKQILCVLCAPESPFRPATANVMVSHWDGELLQRLMLLRVPGTLCFIWWLQWNPGQRLHCSTSSIRSFQEEQRRAAGRTLHVAHFMSHTSHTRGCRQDGSCVCETTVCSTRHKAQWLIRWLRRSHAAGHLKTAGRREKDKNIIRPKYEDHNSKGLLKGNKRRPTYYIQRF